MTLHLVRHAQAGARSRWHGDDTRRPLTSEGRHQAADIAGVLIDCGPLRVLSSPFRRCIETIVPAAAALGLCVEIDDRLAEGPGGPALALARELAGHEVVMCSHGDVIPSILDALRSVDGLDLGVDPRCQKGSIWMLEPDAAMPGRFASATYVPPPRQRTG